MKTLISKIALAVFTASVVFYGCSKNTNISEQEKHDILDKQDNQTMVSIQTETNHSKSYNEMLVLYHDSLTMSTSAAFTAHCNDMMHYYDNLYHNSVSMCQGYDNHLNNIHTCGMMSNCQSMMGGSNGGMMGNNSGGMMGSGSSSLHCSIMTMIQNNCTTVDDLNNKHTKYCLR